MRSLALLLCAFWGCSPTATTRTDTRDLALKADSLADLAGPYFDDGWVPLNTDDGGSGDGPGVEDACVTQPQACYIVYAHSDHVLYKIDLKQRSLVVVGPFNAPQVNGNEDVMTDLAVATDDTIYVISGKSLYTASPVDGHVTRLGALGACGSFTVGLSFDRNGTLYAGDFNGAFCKIDPTKSPPTVTPIMKLSGGLALSGDLVAVGDGTMYGTAYRLSDAANTGTQNNNLLVKIDPANGTTTIVGSTGAKRLYGTSYALGQVFAFTHDGSGQVHTVNPSTGAGTLFGTFSDPTTNDKIWFAGAGVNALVLPAPVM